MGLGQGLPRGGSAGGARPRRPRGRGTVGGRSVWIRGVVEIKAPSGGAGAASADGPLGLRGGSARGARPGLRDQAGGASTAPHLRSRTPSGVGLGPLRRRRVPADSGIPPSRWSLRDLTPLLDPFGAAATDALAAVDAIRAGGSRGGASSRAEPRIRGHFVGLRGAGATLTGPGCGALAILAPRPGPAEALPPPSTPLRHRRLLVRKPLRACGQAPDRPRRAGPGYLAGCPGTACQFVVGSIYPAVHLGGAQSVGSLEEGTDGEGFPARQRRRCGAERGLPALCCRAVRTMWPGLPARGRPGRGPLDFDRDKPPSSR